MVKHKCKKSHQLLIEKHYNCHDTDNDIDHAMITQWQCNDNASVIVPYNDDKFIPL